MLMATASARRLEDRIAVVTGGSGAIGRAVAMRLAHEGARVAVTARDAGRARAVAEAIEAAGGLAKGYVLDISSAEEPASLIAAAEGDLDGPLEILVSAAGIQSFGSIFELPIDEWDRIFAVNVRGTFLLLRAAARAMRVRRRGAIVTISSVQGRIANPLYPHYAASKAAVISLTKSFAAALAADGIRVNSVAPGMIDSPMWDEADREFARRLGLPSGEPRRRRIGQIPLGRPGTPDDVAAAVAYLVSDDAAYVTGECLHVSGGDIML
jgi:NAD(P)-dependent dehydrogenase (short-subunit alcohol dehydrogenase family)